MRSGRIILLSGGIDSTVALAHAKETSSEPIVALAVDYGQRNIDELYASWLVAEYYEVEWRRRRVETPCHPLEPDPKYPERSPFFIPGRNALLLAMALAQAESVGYETIIIGATAEDAEAFRDTRPIFLTMFQRMAQFATGKSIQVQSPLLSKTKREVVRYGVELDAPLALTRSCYRLAGTVHCGTCPACLIRRDAFPTADDPTEYAE